MVLIRVEFRAGSDGEAFRRAFDPGSSDMGRCMEEGRLGLIKTYRALSRAWCSKRRRGGCAYRMSLMMRASQPWWSRCSAASAGDEQ